MEALRSPMRNPGMLSVRQPLRSEPAGQQGMYAAAGDVLTFVIAATSRLLIKAGGDLPIADLVLFPMLPILFVTKGRRLRRSGLGIIFVLLGLWFFNQAVTDVYRRTEMIDWVRVNARMVFIVLDILGLAMLIGRNVRRQVVFLVGYAIAFVVRGQIQGFGVSDTWKFAYSTTVGVLVALLSSYFYSRHRYLIAGLLLLGVAAVNVAFNNRAPVLNLFVTIVLAIPIVPKSVGRLRILPRSPGLRIAVLSVMVLAAGAAANTLIVYLASSGYLGERAREKDLSQAQAKGGMLLGGRSEILVTSRAVIDSPILGHGSWAKDIKYREMYNQLVVQNNIREREAEDEGELIPTHSHIMGAWVEAGILGAVFWVYILVYVIRALIRVVISRPSLTPVYVYMFIEFIWAIAFSPAGGVTILLESGLLVMATDILETLPRLVSESQNPGATRTSRRLRSGHPAARPIPS